jgi:acetyl-CoA carboxylase carboxyltransferase component
MWSKEVEELKRRKNIAYRMGGKKNIEKHHAHGHMTVRERIKALVDQDSFLEVGVLAGRATYDKTELQDLIPCPIVIGLAKLNGQTIILQGDDFTIKGAAIGKLFKEKLSHVTQMAYELKVPLIRMLDGGGGTVKEVQEIGHTDIPTGTDTWAQNAVDIMSMVPIVSIAMGPTAGFAPVLLVESHFSIMVKETSQVFVGGPPLVQWAFGQKISKEDLGGYKIHAYLSGVVDNIAENEEDALNQARAFLDYMPSNVWEMPERKYIENDDPERREERLLSLIPRDRGKSYDMRKIINLIFDKDSVFEMARHNGQSQIVALARLNGYVVGVIANDPMHKAGSFAWDSAEKFGRFVDMCDQFHIPIVNFVDQPGFFIGKDSEEHGTVRKGVRASFAIMQATVPLMAIYVRRCFGAAGAVQSNPKRLKWRYAWPSAVWGNLPIEGGVYAAHRAEIDSSNNPERLTAELTEMYHSFESPFRTAEAFGIEDIIDPRDTRPVLCKWIETVWPLEARNMGIKKRGIRC